MNTQAIPTGLGFRPTDGDVKIDRHMSFTRRRLIVLLVVLALSCYSLFSYFQTRKLEDANIELENQKASMTMKVVGLEAQSKTSLALSAENKRLKGDLTAEINRKNFLAVQNTELKGRVVQGERDLKAALDKLKTFEHQKPVKKH
jgi:cell division protein FtsB